MNWINKNLYLAAIPISMLLSTVSLVSVQANFSKPIVRKLEVPTLISQNFNPPDKGAPESTAGGATRGGCTQKENRLISLIPEKQVGLTFNERPTFYWHISEPDVREGTFMLVDDNGDVVYQTDITLPQKPGIFAFTLPAKVPGLKVNKQYNWFLEVNCNSQTDEILTVEGWIERIKPSLPVRMKLNKLEPKHRSKIYADAGIWHEAIDNIAQQRCKAPDDSTTMIYWNQLLTSVGLKELASEPINNICTVDN